MRQPEADAAFTDDDVEEWHCLETAAVNGTQAMCAAKLAQGDLLLRKAPIRTEGTAKTGAMAHVRAFAERVNVVFSTANNMRSTAAFMTAERRQKIAETGVTVSFSALLTVALQPRGNDDGEARFQSLLALMREARRKNPRNPRVTVGEYRDAIGAPLDSGTEGGVPVARVVRQVTARPDIVTALVEDDDTARKLVAAYAITRPDVARAVAKADPEMAGALQAEAARRDVPAPSLPAPRTAAEIAPAPEVDPDDQALDDYVDGLADVQLSKWRADLAGDLSKLAAVMLRSPQDVAAKADQELLDRVLELCDKVTAWGEQIRAEHPQMKNTVDFNKIRRDRVAGSHG
ncbi:hypothetical protein [Streptomyces erythrochromogenes]|uniref:hypothetical protein n=1 Tax=Streptomyces erythrochromogenes TaxID=285574 RepID=UPI0037D17E7D